MRDDAEAIWTAAMRAVQPERLVAARLSLEGGGRQLCHDRQPLDPPLRLDDVDRIMVVGAGKAAAGMAAAMERLLGPEGLARHRVTGLVSVPAGCGRRLTAIEVFAGACEAYADRPALGERASVLEDTAQGPGVWPSRAAGCSRSRSATWLAGVE